MYKSVCFFLSFLRALIAAAFFHAQNTSIVGAGTVDILQKCDSITEEETIITLAQLFITIY